MAAAGKTCHNRDIWGRRLTMLIKEIMTTRVATVSMG